VFESIWTCFEGGVMANFKRKAHKDFARRDTKPVASKILYVRYFLLKDNNKEIAAFRLCALCENLCVLRG
jgi:hypothetical protein